MQSLRLVFLQFPRLAWQLNTMFSLVVTHPSTNIAQWQLYTLGCCDATKNVVSRTQSAPVMKTIMKTVMKTIMNTIMLTVMLSCLLSCLLSWLLPWILSWILSWMLSFMNSFTNMNTIMISVGLVSWIVSWIPSWILSWLLPQILFWSQSRIENRIYWPLLVLLKYNPFCLKAFTLTFEK